MQEALDHADEITDEWNDYFGEDGLYVYRVAAIYTPESAVIQQIPGIGGSTFYKLVPQAQIDYLDDETQGIHAVLREEHTPVGDDRVLVPSRLVPDSTHPGDTLRAEDIPANWQRPSAT